MRIMAAKEAKNRFGELLMEAQKAPVTNEKNGKPVAALYAYGDHVHIEQARLDCLRAAVVEGLADLEAGCLLKLDDTLVEAIKADGSSPLDDA